MVFNCSETLETYISGLNLVIETKISVDRTTSSLWALVEGKTRKKKKTPGSVECVNILCCMYVGVRVNNIFLFVNRVVC